MGKAKILLVDGNVERREKVEKLVATGGFDVSRTETAYRALAAMKTEKFGALLVSGDLPDDQAGSLIVIVNSHPSFQALPLVLLYCHPSDIGLKRTREFPVSGQINDPLLGRGLIAKLEEITTPDYETPGVMKTIGVAPPESIGKTALRPKSHTPSAAPLPSALPSATGQRFGGGVQPTVIREIAPDAAPDKSSAQTANPAAAAKSALPPLPTLQPPPPLPTLAIPKPPLPPLARPMPPLPNLGQPRPPVPPSLLGALGKVKHALEDADAAAHSQHDSASEANAADDDVQILPDEAQAATSQPQHTAPASIPKPPRPKLPADLLGAFPAAAASPHPSAPSSAHPPIQPPIRPPARPPADLYQLSGQPSGSVPEPISEETQTSSFEPQPNAASEPVNYDDPYPPNEELLFMRLHNFDHREVQAGIQTAGWEFLGEQPGLRPGLLSYLYQRGDAMLNLYVDEQNIIQMISIT